MHANQSERNAMLAVWLNIICFLDKCRMWAGYVIAHTVMRISFTFSYVKRISHLGSCTRFRTRNTIYLVVMLMEINNKDVFKHATPSKKTNYIYIYIEFRIKRSIK